MSESRSAESLVLDAIIANALARCPSESFEDHARVVTDALLAKGRVQKRELPVYTDAQVREQPYALELVIPLEAS